MKNFICGLKSKKQKGSINLQGLMMMGIGFIFLAVAFIIYPIIMDGTDAILDWTASESLVNLPGYAAGPPVVPATIDIFTGLEQVTGIVPLLVLVGIVVAGVFSGILGFKMVKTGAGAANMGGLLLLGIGVIFIAVVLLIFPVVMDGIASAYDAALAGTSYTGLDGVLPVVPLIVEIAFISGGIVSGFFGTKTIASTSRA